MKALPVAEQLPALASITGLDKFVRMRGITDARVKACLNDEAAMNLLQQINKTAVATYHITGTPSFVINGQLAEGVYNWETLEPRLQQALGG
jgi:protein-disulfide isomerase